MRFTKKRSAVLAAAVLSACVLAGGVIAGHRAGPPDPDVLGAAIEEAQMTRVADIPASSTAPARGVFVQVTSNGHLCLWDAPSATSRERGGGCNPLDDPLGGRMLSASLGYDGGPGIATVRDARLVGLASTEVAGVHVVMSDGSQRRVALQNAVIAGVGYRAFGYRFRPSDLRKGLGPTAVVARDDAGEEIGREATGFG